MYIWTYTAHGFLYKKKLQALTITIKTSNPKEWTRK